MGLFDNLINIGKEVQDGITAAEPTTAAVKQALNILPDGELKNWLMANPVAFFNRIFRLIKGARFQAGQYRLGERLLDNVLNKPTASYRDVSDDYVKLAQYLFTVLLGVRINNDEDMWALDNGVEAYYARPNKQDIPLAAVQRAVNLKQTYYPASTYNKTVWDLRHFENSPLVAPIPAVGIHDTLEEQNVGKLFNGELPGGAVVKNGVIDGNDALKKLLTSMGYYDQPVPGGGGGGVITDPEPTEAGFGTTGMIILALVAVGFIASTKKSRRG